MSWTKLAALFYHHTFSRSPTAVASPNSCQYTVLAYGSNIHDTFKSKERKRPNDDNCCAWLVNKIFIIYLPREDDVQENPGDPGMGGVRFLVMFKQSSIGVSEKGKITLVRGMR